MGLEHIPQERIYRGFELEQACLGHKIDWEKIFAKNKVSPETLGYEQCEKIIRELYPDDPTMPKKKWGKDLYNFVADKLRLDMENPEGLYFYSSLGSPLDKMGVDCFFVYTNPQTKKEATFTIDLTANPKKDEYRADLVMGEMPDHRANPDEYSLELEKIADQIAENLKTKTAPIH